MSLIRTGVVLLSCLTGLSANNDHANADDNRADPPASVGLGPVLLDSEIPLEIAVADVDADQKLDLIVGSANHDYDPIDNKIRRGKNFFRGNSVSFHLRQSDQGPESLKSPVWPLKELGEEFGIPLG